MVTSNGVNVGTDDRSNVGEGDNDGFSVGVDDGNNEGLFVGNGVGHASPKRSDESLDLKSPPSFIKMSSYRILK